MLSGSPIKLFLFWSIGLSAFFPGCVGAGVSPSLCGLGVFVYPFFIMAESAYVSGNVLFAKMMAS